MKIAKVTSAVIRLMTMRYSSLQVVFGKEMGREKLMKTLFSVVIVQRKNKHFYGRALFLRVFS